MSVLLFYGEELEVSRFRNVIRQLPKMIVFTVVFFLLLEGLLRIAWYIRNSHVDYIPLPFALDTYGPVPPWVDGLRILKPDPILSWRVEPNIQRKYIDVFSPVDRPEDRFSFLRQFRPIIPASLRNNPTWEISTNSAGFRDSEFPRQKSPSVLRVICLGDSWTFGFNVGQDQGYPQGLGRLLSQEHPSRKFEVFNLGVPAYSSHQGKVLLETKTLDWQPDIVTIAFGMNDAGMAGYRDKDTHNFQVMGMNIARHVIRNVETVKLLWYYAQLLFFRPPTIGEHMQRRAAVAESGEAHYGREGNEWADYDKFESATRVSPGDYEKNIVTMIRLAKGGGADVVLLFNEFWNTPYRKVVKKVAVEHGLPLVDSKALIDQARARIEQDLEEELDLQPPMEAAEYGGGESREVEVVFRVRAGKYAVRQAMYIAGTDPELGNTQPNAVAMYDDGAHGDQKAGDKVWSYAARLPVGKIVYYVYTNSGTKGEWEGVDVPELRYFTVPTLGGRRVYRPIDTFGELYLQADAWHTNAAGYDMIASALLETFRPLSKFRQHISEP